MAARGLLRLPAFLHELTAVVKSEYEQRTQPTPVLLSVHAHWRDFYITFGLTVFLFALRIGLESMLFARLFKRFDVRKRAKLGENLFYTTYYIFSFLYFWFPVRSAVDWGTSLVTNDDRIVQRLMMPHPAPMVMEERFYYAMGGGFYAAGTLFLTMFDARRSDFAEHFIHHVVTLGLIAMSYLYGYTRVGILVLALHDIGDIFLHGAKFIHYLGFAGWDTALFACFTASFYFTRLVMLPRIWWAVAVDTLFAVVKDPKIGNWAMFFQTYLVHWVFFVLFLGTLIVLHCFWFSLCLRMIYREVVVGIKISDEGDIRSDDEEEADDDKVIAEAKSRWTAGDQGSTPEGKKSQ